MKKVVYKCFVNFEKEEKWLNECSAKGYHLVDYSFCRYTFEEREDRHYIYRLELLKEMPGHLDSQSYIRFLESSGIECVATYLRWAYFRYPVSEKGFELYTDYEGKYSQYKRALTLVGIAVCVNIFPTINMLRQGVWGIAAINGSVSLLLMPVLLSYLRAMWRLKKEKKLYES